MTDRIGLVLGQHPVEKALLLGGPRLERLDKRRTFSGTWIISFITIERRWSNGFERGSRR